MKMNLLKRITIILICLFMVLSINYSNFATSNLSSTVSSYSGTITKVDDAAKMSRSIIGTILTIIRTVAAAVALVVLVIIACKYIIASAGDRADIKKYAVNYIIGAVILFSASALTAIIQKFVEDSLG